MPGRRTRALLVAAAVATAGAVAAGCGTDEPAPSPRSTIPHSLRVVESGAEDTTDFVLAGERAKAVASATALDRAAQGPAAADLTKAHVSRARIDELQARAAALKRIVARGKAIEVALSANRAFSLVPALFAVYRDPVPADVTRLDYFDFEAKLEALAGDRGALQDAARGLAEVWRRLREPVAVAGGRVPAAAFDAHVRTLRRLVRDGAGSRAIAGEAQHGLDLVDELEAVYAG
jgi:hypothetical protein